MASARQPAAGGRGGGLALADAPPQARFVSSADADVYAEKANRIVVKHEFGQVVAVIEVLSPGNKSSRYAVRSLVNNACDLIHQGIHLLMVDLFGPSPRDPQGIHMLIWESFCNEPAAWAADKPLTAAAYFAGIPQTAYVEPLAVGDALPSLPLFLASRIYVPAPLESTYQTAWQKCPAVVRQMVAGQRTQETRDSSSPRCDQGHEEGRP